MKWSLNMDIELSIVIPNYNGRKLLEKNLPAVLDACKKWGKNNWEIIVVDDASTDDSVDFLIKKFPEVIIINHLKTLRFAESCNSGVKDASGDIVVLLNNDVSPEIDFLSPLINHFSDYDVFAVGCREKSIKTQHVIYSGRGIMKFKRGLVIHWRAENQNQRSTSWVAGGSGAFSKNKWLEIGGMDKLFRPAYEEDRDLCYRALKHGWKILFEPKSVVYHQHETTNIKVFGKTKIKIISFKNQFLFVWKNLTDRDYLLKHIAWLPYHLLLTNFRSRGLLLIGFLLAVTQLPEAIRARFRVKKLFVRKDKRLI